MDKPRFPSTLLTLLAALDFAVLGFVVAWLLLQSAAEDWQVLRYTAPPAAFLTALFFWSLLVSAREEKIALRGMFAGGLIGLFSHPLAWYLAVLYLHFSGARSSLGEATLDPVAGMPVAMLYSLLSLLAAGWITVPLGATAGGGLAVLYRALSRRRPGG